MHALSIESFMLLTGLKFLTKIDSRFFIKSAEKIIFGKDNQFAKAEKLIELEAIRSIIRHLNDYQTSLIAKRYENLL